MGDIEEIKKDIGEIKTDVAEIKTTLMFQEKILDAQQANIQVLNEAHVKNETDHASILNGLGDLSTQWKTVVKMVGLIISASSVVIVALNFFLEHFYR